MAQDEQVTAALMVRLPERASWSMSVGDQTSKGRDWHGLIRELAAAESRPTTISLTLLLELNAPSDPGFDGEKGM